jgi:hypothetical protein
MQTARAGRPRQGWKSVAAAADRMTESDRMEAYGW